MKFKRNKNSVVPQKVKALSEKIEDVKVELVNTVTKADSLFDDAVAMFTKTKINLTSANTVIQTKRNEIRDLLYDLSSLDVTLSQRQEKNDSIKVKLEEFLK